MWFPIKHTLIPFWFILFRPPTNVYLLSFWKTRPAATHAFAFQKYSIQLAAHELHPRCSFNDPHEFDETQWWKRSNFFYSPVLFCAFVPELWDKNLKIQFYHLIWYCIQLTKNVSLKFDARCIKFPNIAYLYVSKLQLLWSQLNEIVFNTL